MSQTKHKYGYVRVSTADQNADLQTEALRSAGCEIVFSDIGVSGKQASRPELDRLLERLLPGDELVVWKLDRLGRDTRNLLDLLDDLKERGVKFRSLTEGLSTDGPMGTAMVTIMSAFAQLERDTMLERTHAGLASARARGKFGGRPSKLTPDQVSQVLRMYATKELSLKKIGEVVHVSKSTVQRVILQEQKRLAEQADQLSAVK